MRVLALDIGERRVGVALSDPARKIASPYEVFDANAQLAERIAALVEEHGVGLVVVGLPLTMSGDEGPQAQRVRRVGELIAERLTVPVVYHDERLSSAEANRAMKAAADSRRRRGSVDKVAAAVFLQSYLDAGGPDSSGLRDEDADGG